MNLFDDLIDMAGVVLRRIDLKDEIRTSADIEPLGKLTADESLRPFERSDRFFPVGRPDKCHIHGRKAVVIGDLDIGDCDKSDIGILDLKLDDLRKILADDAFQAFLFDA